MPETYEDRKVSGILTEKNKVSTRVRDNSHLYKGFYEGVLYISREFSELQRAQWFNRYFPLGEAFLDGMRWAEENPRALNNCRGTLNGFVVATREISTRVGRTAFVRKIDYTSPVCTNSSDSVKKAFKNSPSDKVALPAEQYPLDDRVED